MFMNMYTYIYIHESVHPTCLLLCLPEGQNFIHPRNHFNVGHLWLQISDINHLILGVPNDLTIFMTETSAKASQRHPADCQAKLVWFILQSFYCVDMQKTYLPVVPHKAVAEVSKIGNL